LAGGEIAYNVQDGKITRFGAALGYLNKDYSVALHGNNNFSTFSAGFYHVVKPDLEAGAKAVYDKKSAGNVAIELGTKYTLDNTTFVKAKVNNAGILGLGLTQTVRPGIKVSLGGFFDTARFSENAHKLGISLNLEA
jgi:voltage-dependent anion channel protein 2